MKPSMFTTQMKIISVATYGNQRRDRLVRQALLGDLGLRDLVDHLARRAWRRPGSFFEPTLIRISAIPSAHVRTAPSSR